MQYDDIQPNILWICTDQQRFDTLHNLNNPYIHTPNLDRLMKSGVTFTRTYCQNTVCTPSRASFLTGRYPRTTRTVKNGGESFSDDEVLVSKILSDNGYSCGLVGKLHLSAADGRVESRPANDGYEVFKWSHGPRNGWGSANAYQSWLNSQGISWEDEYHGREGGIDPQFHQTTWCVNESIRFIQERRDRPWLLSVNIFDPHPPFDPPTAFKQRYQVEKMPLPKWREGELDNKPLIQQQDYEMGGQGGHGPSCKQLSDEEQKMFVADYYAMIELVDEQIGRLIDFLETSGQIENTIILFHSDHGEMLGDHGLILKGAYFYEGLVHVPLIISCPKRLLKNTRRHALVELVDLAPTILDLVGIDIPGRMQGKSLYPLLNDGERADFHKESVFCEYYYSLPDIHHNIYATMYYDGRYKLVVYHGQNVGELYDHQNDPDEYENRWFDPAFSEVRTELLTASYARSVLTVDPEPPIVGRF